MWIKICGIKTPDDAEMVAQCGADAIGLNFYSGSKRFVTAEVARTIRATVGSQMEVVGVFVNSSAEDVARIAATVGLTTVQFHGDESATDIARFAQMSPEMAIIRAFRVGPEGYSAVDHSLAELSEAGVRLHAVLIDAYKPGEFGGTGHQLSAAAARDWIQQSAEIGPPVILAGGLTPDTVAAAIKTADPWGIDTASGVETAPGVKCEDKVRAFVTIVRQISNSRRIRPADDSAS